MKKFYFLLFCVLAAACTELSAQCTSDQTAPVINCTQNITVAAGTGVCNAVVTVPQPTVSDNCTPAVTIDQQHTSSNNSISSIGYNQSFTPAVTGYLVQINFPGITSFSNANATLKLYDGDNDNEYQPGGTLIYSQSIVLNTGTTSASLTAPVHLQKGHLYTWQIANGGSVSAYFSTDESYTSGHSGSYNGFPSGWDLLFITYMLPDPVIFTNNFNNSNDASGTYPVGTTSILWTATDFAGNTSTCTTMIAVTDNQPPVITGCPMDITSCGNVINWTPPVATDNCGIQSFTSNYQPGATFPVGTTIVTYTATDIHNNISTCSFNVTVKGYPAVHITSSDNLNCLATSATLKAENVHDSYSWSNGATTSSITVTTAGLYKLTGTVNGCSASDSVNIAFNKAVLNPVALPATICAGESVQLKGGFVSGPGTLQTQTYYVGEYDVINFSSVCSPYYMYTTSNSNPGFRWQDNGSGAVQSVTVEFVPGKESSATGTVKTISFNNQNDGSYLATNLCNDCFTNPPASAKVTLNLTPAKYNVGGLNTVYIPNNGPYAQNGSWALANGLYFDIGGWRQYVKITVTYLVYDGTYTWSPGGGSAERITVKPGETTTYTVTANKDGCIATADVTVSVTPRPVITVSGAVSNLCQAESVTLSTATAGSYLWSTGETTQSITVNSGGTYSVTASNCTAANPVAVTYKPLPTISVNGFTGICPGQDVTLTATAGNAYVWSTGATAQSITVSAAGGYTVNVTDSAGCSQTSATTNITVAPIAPVVYPSDSIVIDPCNGGFAFASVDYYTWDGYTVTWYKAGNPVPVSNDYYLYTNEPGDYTVIVSRGGCTSDPVVVHVSGLDASAFGDNAWKVYHFQDYNYNPNNPAYGLQGSYTESSLSFDTRNRWPEWAAPDFATGYSGCGYDYEYFKFTAKRKGFACGHYTIDIPAHDDDAALYINGLKVWEHIGCCDAHTAVWEGDLGPDSKIEYEVKDYSGSAYGAITFNLINNSIVAKPTVTPSGSVDICSNTSVTLTSSAETGNTWSNGETTQNINVNTAGNYYVTVAGAAGCTVQSDTVILTVTPATIFCRDADGDGYGDINNFMQACAAPSGYVSNSADCNDTHISVYPNAPEICDGLDNDCDGLVDEGFAAPAQPRAISASQRFNLCNATVQCSVQPVAGATSYTWYVPSGCSVISGQGSTSVTIATGSSFAKGIVSVTADKDCKSSAARNIVLYGKPSKPLISGPACVTANQGGITYTVTNPEPGVIYTWKVPGQARITGGQGTASVTVNWKSTSGTISCTPRNTCAGGARGSYAVTVGCAAVAKSSADNNKFIAYPNPTGGIVSVLFAAPKETKYIIIIQDINGRQIIRKELTASAGDNKVSFDLSKYANGIYMVNLAGEDDVKTIKVVKAG